MIQIIAVVVFLLALGGGVWSYNHSLRAEGEAKARAELVEQQRVAAEENARVAELGRQEAIRLLGEAEKRNKVQAQQMIAAQRQRRAESETQAAKDADYAFWSKQLVHPFELARLRDATKPPAAESNRSDVSSGIALQAREDLPAGPGDDDQRRLRRIRLTLGLDAPTGMDEHRSVTDSVRGLVAHAD